MTLPDGPTVIPYLHSLKWKGRYLEFLDWCAQRYGSIFTFKRVGSSPYVVVSHPQAIKEIFTAPAKYFDSGKANQPFSPFLGNNSLLLLDGNEHQQQRKLLMPPFHGDCLQSYSKIICDTTYKEIGGWSVNQPFVIRSRVQILTLQIVLQVLFGSVQEQRVQKLNQCLVSLVNSFLSPLPWQLIFFSQKKRRLDQLIYAEIDQRRQQVDFSSLDILNLLLTACDDAGQVLTGLKQNRKVKKAKMIK